MKKQPNRDHLDHQAAHLWQQYPQANDVRAQQAFWAVYDELLVKAKKPAKTKLQPATIPRPLAADNIDWSPLLVQHLRGLSRQVTFEDPKVVGCVLLLKIVLFIGIAFFGLVTFVASSFVGFLITAVAGVLVWKGIKYQSETVYYTFDFEEQHIRCVKKTVYSKTRKHIIDLPVPYATIHQVQEKQDDGGISLINTSEQPWIATSHTKFSKVNIPAGITHLAEVRGFLEAVAQHNRQLNVRQKP